MLRSARVFLGAAAAAWLVIAAHAFGVARRPLWRRWDLGAAPPSDNGDLNDLTVSHMKELLRAAGLPVSGLKKDLIGRLIDAFPSFAGGGTAAVAPKKELPKATSARVEISPPLPPPSPDAAAAAAAATGGAGAACVLQFDGGSRGNPGPAGAGSLLMDAATGAVLWEACVYLGPRHTNNVAEYRGVIAGLKQAVEMGVSALTIQGDSQLVLKQLHGTFKVKNADLQVLHAEASALLRRVPRHALVYIPRAENARADALANEAMDSRASRARHFF